MKKILLQVFIVLVGLGGLNAGLFSGCKASLVKDAAKTGVIPIKTKTALNKCITDPKLAADNPNFVAALDHTCTTDEKFKTKFSKACGLAAKAAGGEEEEEDTSSKGHAGKGKSGKGSGNHSSEEHDHESSSEKTCTCICQTPAPQAPAPQAQMYSQPQPAYDPYYGQQQQYQQQYQQQQYGYPVQ